MINLGNFLTIKEREIKNTVSFINNNIPLVIGDFEWGAVEYPQLIQNLRVFEEIYGIPFTKKDVIGNYINNNEHEWFTVDNLLNYGSSVLINRVLDEDNSFNSHYFIPSAKYHGKSIRALFTSLDGDTTPINVDDVLLTNEDFTCTIKSVDLIENNEYSLTITDINGYITNDMSLTLYNETIPLYTLDFKTGIKIEDVYYNDLTTLYDGNFDNSVKSIIKNDELVEKGAFIPAISDNELVKIYARYPGEKGNDIYINYCGSNTFETFEYINGRLISKEFSVTSINDDEIAIMVLKKNNNGTFEILERHIVSLNIDAKDSQGNSKYIEEYLLRNSAYIYGYINSSNLDIIGLNNYVLYFEEPLPLQDGKVSKVTESQFTTILSDMENFSAFNFKYVLDCGLFFTDFYKKSLITLAENRKDCIAILGLNIANATSTIIKSKSSAVSEIKKWFKEFNRRSTYYAIAGEYKYKRNRYNGKYFWTHMADDLAGVCIYSDDNFSAWNSAMGYDYGLVRDNYIAKLGINYDGDLLDEVYKTGINPFILDNEGIICLGNKTGHSDFTSDYSSLHIRRLLIFIEKNIAGISKRVIGTVNDEFTRNQFSDGISEFLNRILAGRGLYNFMVVCDETNNTSNTIDNKEFICDVYIKPTKLAEFVRINVINTSNSISFTELF